MTARNETQRQQDRDYREERLRHYNSRTPQLKKVLGFTVRMGWKMMKGLVKIAIRIPGLTRQFIQATQKPHPSPDSNPQTGKPE